MTAAIHAVSVNLVEVNCGVCGGVYAINERKHEWSRENGKSWNCPYCQTGWGFSHEGTELARARKALETERDRLQKALARANEATAARDKAERALKRHKTRVGNGTCPCCQRTFKQLARHMALKHPEYGK